MNIGKAFTYVFDDPQWLQKVLFGALFQLLSLVLIGIPFVLGYIVEIIRNVHRGDPSPLPEWTNLGDKFSEGLKLLVVLIVYALPAILLSCCGQIFQQVAIQTSNQGGRDTGAIAGVLVAVGLAFSCLQFLYGIVLAVLIPAVYVQFARTSGIAESLRFGEVIGIVRRNLGPVIIVALLGIVTGFITFLGVIACFIGIVVTAAYAAFVTGHLYGQLWQEVDRTPGVQAY